MQHVDPVEMCEARVECCFLLLSRQKRGQPPPAPLILCFPGKNYNEEHEGVDSSSVQAHLLYNARNTENTTER